MAGYYNLTFFLFYIVLKMYLNVSETMYIKCTSGHILGTLGTYWIPLAHGVHLSMCDDPVGCKDMYSEIWVDLRCQDTFY